MDTVAINAGSPMVRDVHVFNVAEDGTKTPYDLTGHTATMKVYDRPGGEFEFDGVIEIIDAEDGYMVASVPGSMTDLPYHVLYFDVTLDTSHQVDEGKLVVRP